MRSPTREAMIGTHKYTIKEVLPADQANIQYDEGQVDVTVTVTKDEASNAIQAVVSYGAKKTFINKVIPPTPPTVNNPELKLYTLRVRKVDEKGDYLAGAVFGLFEADGVTPVANPYGQGQAQAISGQDGLASFVGFEAKRVCHQRALSSKWLPTFRYNHQGLCKRLCFCNKPCR